MKTNQPSKLRKFIERPNNALVTIFLCVVYIWTIIHTYDFQIAEANTYAGMQSWEMTIANWICLSIIVPTIAVVISRLKGNPSDFFLIFYSFIPVFSFYSLISTSGKISDDLLLSSFVIILFPLLALLVVKNFMPKIKWRGFISAKIIDQALLGILFLVVSYSYFNSPLSAGFDIDSSYERRLEGRDIYIAGSLIAYALAMCLNGLAPYLAFRSAFTRKNSLITISLCATIFFYWLLGVKAPFFYVTIAYVVGYLMRIKKIKYFSKYFILGIILLYIIVSIEWLFFDGYSLIADYGFRRLFPVQAEVQGFYLDFLLVNTPSFWNFLIGVSDQSFAATYYIGINYLGNPDSNVNTNAFLYAFMANGFLGYLFATLFISIFLVVLDRLYQSTKNPTYILIGFVYGYLLSEQAFTTAMVSSGVGLLFLLTLFEKNDIRIGCGSVKLIKRDIV